MAELQNEHKAMSLTVGDMKRQIRDKDSELELAKEAMEKFQSSLERAHDEREWEMQAKDVEVARLQS